MESRLVFFLTSVIVDLGVLGYNLEPPMGLKAFAISPNAFRVKWTENYRNQKRSTSYTLRYRKLPDGEDFAYVNTTKGEVKRLHLIETNASYEFSVKAARGRKESDWSEPIAESLETAIPIGSPRNLKIKQLSPTEIKLKWRRPKTRKHSIDRYRITWKTQGTQISVLKETYSRSYVIRNLNPSTTYIIKVQTIADNGDLSEPAKISHRTKRKFSIPVPTNFTVHVYGSTKLLVSWTLPRGVDTKKLTGFQIQYRQKGVHKGTLCTVVTTKKKQRYIITDLYKGEEYKVRIAAKYGQHTGKSTRWINVELPRGNRTRKGHKDSATVIEEDSVQSNTTIGLGLDDDIISVEVNNTEHTYQGQNVTMTCSVRYKSKVKRSILWSKGDDIKIQNIGVWFVYIAGRNKIDETFIEEGATAVLISRLTLYDLKINDTGTYTCHVITTDHSASLNLQVIDASPGPPENVIAEVLSHNSIGLYWSPPRVTHNFSVTYEVHYWKYHRSFDYDSSFTVKTTTRTQYVITSLKYNTQYSIRVVAVNKYGQSDLTKFENVTVTTFDLKPLEITELRIVNPLIYPSNTDVKENFEESSDSPLLAAVYHQPEITGLAVKVAWTTSVTEDLYYPKQYILNYRQDGNDTVLYLSVFSNSTIVYNLKNDRVYFFRVQAEFHGRSYYSDWRQLSTFLSEDTPPPPPRDMFLDILPNNSLSITWLPPPEEYRIRIQNYKIIVAEHDGKKRFFRLGNHTRELIIPVLDKSKMQTVALSAHNDAGDSDKVIRVLDLDSDSAEGIHLIARTLTSTIIRVSWITSSKTNLTRFLLRYRPISSNISHLEDVFLSPSVTDYVINNLQEYTEYMVSLIPYYNDVPGNMSVTKVWTFVDVPSAPPKDVTVETNETNFIVSWNPPQEHTRNGKLTFYRVEYRTTNDPVSKNILVPSEKNEHILTGLEEGIVYEMRVAAVTVNGTGPFSSWVQMVIAAPDVIEQPPYPPTSVMAEPISSGIKMMWESPRNTSIPIKGYIIGHGRFLPEVYRTILGPSVYEYAITDLRPKARYILTVRAFNDYGESRAVYMKFRSGSEEERPYDTVTTPSTTPIPGAPYDVKVRERGEEVPTALVTWKRPDTKERINGYILLYTNDSTLPLYQWTGVFERSLRYIIKNLSFNHTYYLIIQSQLEDGTSIMSTMTSFTTRAVEKSKGTLPRPKILSAFSGSDYIQITWRPPDYAPIIRGYVLGYGLRQPGEYQEMLPFSETKFKIQNLASETLYHISLRSFGEFGESERAVITVSTTG